MSDATYRKVNDGTHNSSTYHKKDATASTLRSKLKHKLTVYLKKYLKGE